MKKILFLLLVCLIKLNAYHIIVYNRPDAVNTVKEQYYYDKNEDVLTLKIVYSSNASWDSSGESFYGILYSIKRNLQYYISSSDFNNLLKENLDFLNDFYLQQTQAILNYFYNDRPFYATSHVNYENFEILYNDDGLAIESIVNGKWDGLYDDSGQSGYLYNKKGELLYVNGEPASFLEKINNRLLKRFKINLESIFIKKIFYPLLVFIFACVVLRAVIRLALQAFLIRFYDKKISQLEKRREKIENA